MPYWTGDYFDWPSFSSTYDSRLGVYYLLYFALLDVLEKDCYDKDAVDISPNFEYFIRENEYIRAEAQSVYPFELNANACVESVFIYDEDKKIPTAYTYENASGERYLVLLSDSYDMQSNFYRNYTRQQQIYRAVEWMMRKRFPAVCMGNPDLYTLCSEGAGKYVILLCNHSPDYIETPVLQCASNVKEIKVLGGDGKIGGDKILLSELKAYECMAVEFSLE